ncbi:hypothetical protein ILUMI_25492 [Ignelater luminosus]|uniref:Uncharacterized protein n=1 Tax=Ignelater luminosus TaxID=2038154 RepID=A0A8K0C7C0_IGNLU|nr:hypothetical protein ILUMI_25492 [Ignelater luminosus]
MLGEGRVLRRYPQARAALAENIDVELLSRSNHAREVLVIAECEQGIPGLDFPKSRRPKAPSRATANRLIKTAKKPC